MKMVVKTGAQVERVYHVVVDEAAKFTGTKDNTVEQQQAEQAHKRLRTFLLDPGMVGADIVVEQEDLRANTSPEQVKKDEITKLPDGPRAVADTGAVAGGAAAKTQAEKAS